MFTSVKMGNGVMNFRFDRKACKTLCKTAYKILFGDKAAYRYIDHNSIISQIPLNDDLLDYAAWIGLKWENDKLTAEEVEDKISAYLEVEEDDGTRFGELADAISNAIYKAYGEDPSKTVGYQLGKDRRSEVQLAATVETLERNNRMRYLEKRQNEALAISGKTLPSPPEKSSKQSKK